MARVKKRKKIYDPRVWPTWLLVGVAWLVARLPVGAIFRLGRVLGTLGYAVAGARRRITLTNLGLCFPELSEAEVDKLARDSFIHTVTGLLETTTVWLNPNSDIADRTRIYGAEQLQRLRQEGRGVILLGGHFSALDVVGPGLKALDIDIIYRENKNPVWEWLQVSGRRRYFGNVIERSDTRTILKGLKQGRVIWYAADQDYGRKRSVFAPFFGVATASITATAKLAKFNQSPVVLTSHFRDPDTLTWQLYFSDRLTNYPTGDDVADATLINQVIEKAIRSHPEQYLWVHRRFKTRPEGEPSFYR